MTWRINQKQLASTGEERWSRGSSRGHWELWLQAAAPARREAAQENVDTPTPPDGRELHPRVPAEPLDSAGAGGPL